MRKVLLALGAAAVAISACSSPTSSPTNGAPAVRVSSGGAAAEVQPAGTSAGAAGTVQDQNPADRPSGPGTTTHTGVSPVRGIVNPNSPTGQPIQRKCGPSQESAPTCMAK